MLTTPPTPDPPPAAVAHHRHAKITWSYTYRVKDQYGHVWTCFVPVHGPRRCHP